MEELLMNKLGIKKARIILRKLREVRKTATMESASFYLPKEKEDWLKMGNDADTEKIREATRLWRQSWILHPLNEVIKDLEGIYELS